MLIITAKEKITEKLTEASDRLSKAGLFTRSRCYFTDQNFTESAEITEKSRIIFGELTVGAEGLDEDEECVFVICAELKAGEIDDAELENSAKEFDDEIAEFFSALEAAPSKNEAIRKINEKQEAEANAAAEQMMEELRIARKKLFWGIGAIVIIIIGIVIAGSLI